MANVRMTEGFEGLIDSSYHVRREVENGQYSTYTPYVPTDLDYDGTKEIMAGWKQAWGTCDECFMLKSASGSCDCD